MRTYRGLVAVALLLVVLLSFSSFVAAQDTVTLEVWTGSSSPAEDEFKQGLVAAFEEANPGIDVNLLISPDYGTLIQGAFASGDYPDVFTVGQDQFPSLVDSGVLMAAGDNIVEQDDIYPSLLATFSDADGNVYCPAKDFSTLALYYNTDYFDAAGIDYPTADWTWEDMHAAAQAITDAGLTSEDLPVLGFSAAPDRNRWLAFFHANGGRLFDDEGNVVFNSDEAVAALDFYASFVTDGIGDIPANLGGAGWNGEAFARGLAGMTVEGNWGIGYLNNDFPELNWGVAELPTAPSGNKGTLTFTECWAVGANTEQAEAAWALVNAFTGPEGAAATSTAGFGPMPARMSAAQGWIDTFGEENSAFVTSGDYAWAPVFPVGFGDFTTAVDEGTTSTLAGETTAQEALDNAAEVATEIQEEME